MSAMAARTAIVSLGCSCQTAIQINSHIEALSSVIGEPLMRASLPFDWLIAPPASVAGWLANGNKFPESHCEIVQHPNFFWPRYGLHFWHEFTRGGEAALAETFHQTSQKFAHTSAKLERACRAQRRLFVMSNTQNNLDVVRAVSPLMDFTFTAASLHSVVESVNGRFPGDNSFLFLSRSDRATVDCLQCGLDVRLLAPDSSDVSGDPAQWARALSSALGALPALSGAPDGIPASTFDQRTVAEVLT